MRAGFIIGLLLACIGFLAISCDMVEEHRSDTIKLSTKNVELDSIGDSVTILTEGDNWRISGIVTDEKSMYINESDEAVDFLVLDGDWYSIQKQEKHKLHVILSENNTKNSRKIVITIESGNYFDNINVLQKGRE